MQCCDCKEPLASGDGDVLKLPDVTLMLCGFCTTNLQYEWCEKCNIFAKQGSDGSIVCCACCTVLYTDPPPPAASKKKKKKRTP